MHELVSLDAIVKKLGTQVVKAWEAGYRQRYISMIVHDLDKDALDFLRQQKLKMVTMETCSDYENPTIYLEFVKLPKRWVFEDAGGCE